LFGFAKNQFPLLNFYFSLVKWRLFLINMSLTPKKKEYGSYIYKFFEEQDSLSKKYKCKSCENNIVGPVTNLRKHINTNQWMDSKNSKKKIMVYFLFRFLFIKTVWKTYNFSSVLRVYWTRVHLLYKFIFYKNVKFILNINNIHRLQFFISPVKKYNIN